MAATAADRLLEIAAVAARDRFLINHARCEGDVMAETGDKIAALTDVARALVEAAIPFALIGGVAVGIHSGAPRATADVDLAVLSRTERSAIRTALEGVGFRFVGDFAHSMNFRHASGEPVQVAMDPGFDAMIARAEPLVFGGGSVPLVTRADLITMKERAAADPERRKSKRLRDQADVELLRGDVSDPDEGW
jgi:Nucleotidyl transferase AbiEii toxin, Type IV TA system